MARAIAERLEQVVPCHSKPSWKLCDGVALALILANEHGPRFDLATWRALVSREALQEPQAVAIKTAKRSLLQPRYNDPTQQILA